MHLSRALFLNSRYKVAPMSKHEAHTHAEFQPHLAFKLGIGLNLGFCIAEAAIGLLASSMSLVADAVHNFTDVIGLMLAWIALLLGERGSFGRFTFGLKKFSILAAFLNGVFLVVTSFFLAWESIERIEHPVPVSGWAMAAVAGIGIGVNGFTAWLFSRGSKTDINVRGAFLHMLADAIISLGVVISGVAVSLTGLTWIDPIVGLVIVGVILKSTWSLLVESVMQLFDAVPASVNAANVRSWLAALPGVSEVHDLHIWNVGTNLTALSIHLVVPEPGNNDALLLEARRTLKERFRIDHPTIQIERSHDAACGEECEDLGHPH
jgi:cobalt-zinc-cadmium efflux system protein